MVRQRVISVIVRPKNFVSFPTSSLYLCPTVGIGCHLQNIKIGSKSKVGPIVTLKDDSFFQPSLKLYNWQIVFF